MPTPSRRNKGRLTVLLISFAASGCLAVASAAEPKILPIPNPAPRTTSPAPIPAKPAVILPEFEASATLTAFTQQIPFSLSLSSLSLQMRYLQLISSL